MISQTAEYALRAIVFLAENAGKPYTIQQIARTTQVPAGYLAKIMQGLARDGLVLSQRGLRGGFCLARSPADLTVYEVVQAVDPIRRITRCPLNDPAHKNALCALHRCLDEAAATIEESLRKATVADMISRPIFQRKPESDDSAAASAAAHT